MNLLTATLAGAALLVAAAPAAAGVMLGAVVGGADDGNYQSEYATLESAIGRQLAIDGDYDDWGVFPDVARIQWDIQTGRMPLQSWRVLFNNQNPNACATAQAIISGVYDVQLQKQAQAAKALGSTILVRYNYEMTGNKENTCFTGFPVLSNIPVAGREYVAAWRHIVDLFRQSGATNVKWVWAPGDYTFNQGNWQPFYPGDQYVDWIGVDVYNLVDTPQSFDSQPGVEAFYNAMAPFGKPLMVSENGAYNDPTLNPDPETMMISTAREWLEAHPAVAAYVWWDSAADQLPPPPYAGTGYYLVGRGLAAYRAMGADPYFQTTWKP